MLLQKQKTKQKRQNKCKNKDADVKPKFLLLFFMELQVKLIDVRQPETFRQNSDVKTS